MIGFIPTFEKAKKTVNVNAATYTVQTTDEIVMVSYPATGACAITIPAASTFWDSVNSTSMLFVIQDISGNASTHNITIQGTGGETINGSASYVLNTNYEAIEIYTNGTNLFAK